MSEESYRRIFSIVGLALSLGIMFASGFSGIIPGAIFGAGGAVCGGITGEQLYRRNQR